MDEFILVITLDNSNLSQQKWDAGFYRVLGQLWKPGDQLPRKYRPAKLPEDPELLNVYQAWLKDYKDYYKAKKKLNNGFALYQDCDEDFYMEKEDVTQVSIEDLKQKLKDSSDRLKSKVTDWFKYPDFLELELQIRADLADKQQPIIFKKTSLYLAVHEATKKLQSLENEGYLCATMLPVLYHNPSQEPLSWNRLNKYNINNTYPSKQLEGETIFDFFKKAPFSLRNNIPIQTFQKIVNRKTEDFVGREYIFDEIDRYVNDDEQFKSGYIVVLGEPGIGKSAMMAQLVKQKEFVHHFNTENVYSTEQFWANICSQLILKYGLEYSDLPSPERDSPESNFQEEQKQEQKRNMNNENQRIKKYRMFFEEELISQITEKEKTVIILIDALDEAEEKLIQDRSNLLFLPKSLPDGIFFLITARPDKNYSLFVDNRRNIEMDDRDPRNINDVRRYVQEFLNKYREQMLSQIEKWGINDEEFIETITQKSDGNFMYSMNILMDIRDKHLNPQNIDDINNLPQGLESYYRQHWGYMKSKYEERFDKIDNKIIRLLSVVKEPVPVSDLTRWMNIQKHEVKEHEVKEIISIWCRFLNETQSEKGDDLYRIYHSSYHDFLQQTVGFDEVQLMIKRSIFSRIRIKTKDLKMKKKL